jgi:hypothetical protein
VPAPGFEGETMAAMGWQGQGITRIVASQAPERIAVSS